MEGDGAGHELDLEEVDAFAEAAHQGQERRPGVPLVDHVRAVRKILDEDFPEPVDDVTLAIALLHDVLEKCAVHPTILLERWGQEVQEGVTLLSWRLHALDIERPSAVYWSGIRRGPRSVRLVKSADRIHNIRETLLHPRDDLGQWYAAETSRELLPILRAAGETWMVERLEELVQRLDG
jgi:(p)ppGpp synthase/HD superfamily hydrolase